MPFPANALVLPIWQYTVEPVLGYKYYQIMPLISAYVQPVNRLPEILSKIRDGQAPERFTQQLLKDWGFASTNDRPFIPLLKALGFLSPDGKPTQRYHDYRDHSRSKRVLGQAMREAYSDIFLIKEHPNESDRTAVEGKFKSFHNASDNVAGLMAKTFFALLPLADISALGASSAAEVEKKSTGEEKKSGTDGGFRGNPGLHYNIQIHLPATKDTEVFNAIFKSLREHLYEK
jgi:hypothetical protein